MGREAVGAIPRGLGMRLWPFPIHPLLVAAYPILLAYSENLAEVELPETFQPILVAVGVAAVATAVAGLLLRDLRRGALVASAACLVWFGWAYLLFLTTAAGATKLIGVAVIVWLVLMAVAMAIRMPERLIAPTTSACNVVSVLMVALEVVGVAPHALRAATGPVPIAERSTPPAGTRDIWYLVFDRYGNEQAMRDSAGVENDLPAWLREQGFQVAPDARANYGRTAMSLAATLNMTYLDDLAGRLGADSTDTVPLTDMIRGHRVGRLLEELGYRYVHVGSWFGPTRTSAIADENPVLPEQSAFANILRDASFAPVIDRVVGSTGPPQHDMLQRAGASFGWQELDQASQEPGPKFVFGHVLLPHQPYVFNADGSYPHLSAVDSMHSASAHRQQLAYTNGHIRSLVSRLLDVPADQRPIIVISADEGPYPDAYQDDPEQFDWATATDEELVTKYGVLLAMYLPGDAPADAPSPYPDMSVINTFPIVLDRYLGHRIPLLDDRSYTSQSWARPYDLTDVTERLRRAMP